VLTRAKGEGRFATDASAEEEIRKLLKHRALRFWDGGSWVFGGVQANTVVVFCYTSTTLEAEVGIGPFSSQLRGKNALSYTGIN
jgi:hypothetical protein